MRTSSGSPVISNRCCEDVHAEEPRERAPSLSGILSGLLAEYFEKNRAGGACFDVFSVAMDGFSE